MMVEDKRGYKYYCPGVAGNSVLCTIVARAQSSIKARIMKLMTEKFDANRGESFERSIVLFLP